MLRLRVSHAARRDLLEIAEFTRERWGQAQCEKYLSHLDTRLRALTRDSELGRRCDHIKPDYWQLRVGRHLVFYKVAKSSVDVIRVLHERMLPRRHL